MLGAIAGDIIGSIYETNPIKTIDFPLFSKQSRYTDDTVLTVATAYSILKEINIVESFKFFGRMYPGAGYGGSFLTWLISEDDQPYNSWGNGSAMRVSPIGFACSTFHSMMEEAKKNAQVTHNHPEGIKGAQAVASSIYLARNGSSKDDIKKFVANKFHYNLNRSLFEIRPNYTFDVSCQGSVPEAIICFLESNSFEEAVRNAVSLGGDSDTLACIAGSIAHAFYNELSEGIIQQVKDRLHPFLWDITDEFTRKYINT
ncbi:ADP-ribosylglycohydrolase family protein [bacterium]|nr:ADP-ribosylglycohydrolase family protein [bacterium]